MRIKSRSTSASLQRTAIISSRVLVPVSLRQAAIGGHTGIGHSDAAVRWRNFAQ